MADTDEAVELSEKRERKKKRKKKKLQRKPARAAVLMLLQLIRAVSTRISMTRTKDFRPPYFLLSY